VETHGGAVECKDTHEIFVKNSSKLIRKVLTIPPRIDFSYLLDKKFGMLTVLQKDELKSKLYKKQFYLCICECGNYTSVQPYEIINKRIVSCGCYKPTRYKDISNQKFNKLTTIKYIYTKNKKAYWLCECECGNIIITSQSNLNSGHTKSCGCLKYNEFSSVSKHFRNILKKDCN